MSGASRWLDAVPVSICSAISEPATATQRAVFLKLILPGSAGPPSPGYGAYAEASAEGKRERHNLSALRLRTAVGCGDRVPGLRRDRATTSRVELAGHRAYDVVGIGNGHRE